MRIFRKWRNYRQKPPFGSEIDWGDPITNGLIGCWLFNEQVGCVANDLVGNIGDGVFAGSLEWRDNLWFNGGAVKLPKSVYGLNKLTVFTSVKTPNVTNLDVYPYIIDNTDTTSAPANGWRLLYNSDVANYRFIINTGVNYVVDASSGPHNNDKISVYGIYDGTKVMIGINDTIEAETAASGVITKSTETARVGDSYAVTHPWYGYIFCCFLFNRALLDDEILRLHEEPYSFFLAPSPWFMIDLGAVTTGYDRLHQDRRAYRGFMRGVL